MNNIKLSNKFRGQVLKQIYRVWLFRKLLPVLIVEVVIFSFILWQLGRNVFVQKTLENALGVFFASPINVFQFFVSAFTHASFITQLLGVGVVVILALLIRHITQGILRLVLVRENFFSRVES